MPPRPSRGVQSLRQNGIGILRTPRHSGPHRIACIALYRALLRLGARVALPNDMVVKKVHPVVHFVRKGFRRHTQITAEGLVVRALGVGYHAEHLIRLSVKGNVPATEQIHRLLQLQDTKRELSAAQPRPTPRVKPRVWPYPGAPKLLEARPKLLSQLKGRRRVPVLTSAAGMAFLRTRKPQSPFLSRVLRNKIFQSQDRTDHLTKLGEDVRRGAWEEDWDRIVDTSNRQFEPSWKDAPIAAGDSIRQSERKEDLRKVQSGPRYVNVRNSERALSAEEKRTRADQSWAKRQGSVANIRSKG